MESYEIFFIPVLWGLCMLQCELNTTFLIKHQQYYCCSLEAGPGVKMCLTDMLEEFAEIMKLGQKPELAHRLDRYMKVSAGSNVAEWYLARALRSGDPGFKTVF